MTGISVVLSNDEVLNCPSCGNPHLHHHTVFIHNRTKEDGPTKTIAVSHNDMSYSALHDGYLPVGNPSERRQGISVLFVCEICDDQVVLQIAQHEGSSLIWWDTITDGNASLKHIGRLPL
ncbi:MAG: hypothetical protein RL119_1234 [Actinomycetota bacterium]|jgi:hypothetical protein